MVNVVSNIIGAVLMVFVSIYFWTKLFDKPLNYRSLKFYITFFLTALLILINYFYNIVFLRVLVVTVLLCFSNKAIFNESNDKVVVSTILGQVLINACDIFYVLFIVLILRIDINYVSSNIFGTFISNLCVSIIFLLVCRIDFVKKIYMKLLEVSRMIATIRLFIFGVLLIICVNLLMAFTYYSINPIIAIIINIFLIIIYSIIIYISLVQKNNDILIKLENKSLLDNLNQYEKMLDRTRVDNHENKNQLLIVKNMIKKNDKDVVKYIDTVVKDKKEDDEVLYTRVKTIPSGGLQGIIYQKMLTMKDEKILFSLDVSRDLRKIDLDNLSMDDNYKLCKIIGVFLDNAIEESRNIEDKCIMISLYIDEDNLIIDISNRFNNGIDIDKIDDEGYTTKGDGHGYGLSLVKKIVAESNIFENERIVKKDIFKQIIKVKIKNT